MKFIENILSSISGNAKAKVNDPLIGTFILSWIVCNWKELSILFFGEGKTKERIINFNNYLGEVELFTFNSVLVIPFIVTIFYIFVFPWISLLINSLQQKVNYRLHNQAISIELEKTIRQEKLNKQKLIANPEKKFLEQNAQLDIDRRKEIVDKIKSRAIIYREKSEAAIAISTQEKIKLNQLILEEEKSKQKAEIERGKFNLAKSRLQASLASNRFPSAYSFILALEESLKEDDIKLSLSSLSEVIAALFGYKSFHNLLSDEDFNNENLSGVVYVYYVRTELASSLEKIVSDEHSENEDINSETLFDHAISVCEKFGLKTIAKDDAEDIAREFAENHKYDLLNGEELSGAMAESDTIYDDVQIEDIESFDFLEGIKIIFSGTASGSHRKESDVPGRDINFSMEVKNNLLIGTRALGEFEIGEISGGLDESFYGEEEE
jgi:hypothetical protein